MTSAHVWVTILSDYKVDKIIFACGKNGWYVKPLSGEDYCIGGDIKVLGIELMGDLKRDELLTAFQKILNKLDVMWFSLIINAGSGITWTPGNFEIKEKKLLEGEENKS